MDETSYSREMAPLAGYYPALNSPAWWFQDSLNGMARYFDQVMETAGCTTPAGSLTIHEPSFQSRRGTMSGAARRPTGWPAW